MAKINPPWRFDPLQMVVNLSWHSPAGGDFVLIQFTATSGVSGPTGTSLSYAIDPVNGTECALTVSIDELFPGAKIVYQNVNLDVTPTPNYYCYLSGNFNEKDTSVFSETNNTGEPFTEDEMRVFLMSTNAPATPTNVVVGYKTTLFSSHTYQGPNNDFATFSPGTSNTNLADIFNAGGSAFEEGGSGGWSDPKAIGQPGPFNVFDMTLWYVPWIAGVAFTYTATLTATYIIQLPLVSESPPPSPPPPPEIPAFSIRTTGYPWTAEISVFPKEGISVDPTNPSFPLKFDNGHPPLGPDGLPWSPFGTPSDDIKDAFLWKISYEDQAGTAATQQYPFAVVVDDHLTEDPPASPVDPMVQNSILQLYPTFVSTIVTFEGGSDWSVEGYADVPYGTSFKVPDAWSFFTTPGPLPLIAEDVPH